ncbi:MAG: RNA polymerase factor sigma-32 [Syntrophales bacterium]|jgi:RNA polymerase sigma-32 factor|nr:RNA polymerase factor sigma-32 [Syntrophales bacterium]MDY0044850.1 RNA polymerase factor sigma-32 [Syntrophales bacterium]
MMNLPALTDTLDVYMAEINQFAILEPDEEFKLAVQFKKFGDMKSAERLVTSNLRFVVKIAHEYKNYRVRLLDLIQEGNIGLMHAVKKFDPYKGYRLISYAVWWIRAYMQNYIIKNWSLVKIGTTQAQRKLFFKLNQVKKNLEKLSAENPEFREAAELLNVRESDVEEMNLRLSNRDVSLDASLNEEGEALFVDKLVDESTSQEDILIKKEETALVKKNIAGALSNLNERESYIIKNRIMVDKPQTLQEIGDKFNITRERARQIEKEALKKMRLAIPYVGNTSEESIATDSQKVRKAHL